MDEWLATERTALTHLSVRGVAGEDVDDCPEATLQHHLSSCILTELHQGADNPAEKHSL